MAKGAGKTGEGPTAVVAMEQYFPNEIPVWELDQPQNIQVKTQRISK